ncbi:MAG: hypothetical protein IJ020_04935 [Bacteroidaceae bacterium]|nr:hypothetical protein [Bacteroidaceae bacterium]
MKLKYFIFAFTAMLSCFAVSVNAQVAKVGDTEYATIDDAIANCTNGETLTLLADLNLSYILTINKSITLDGNGKTITYTGSDRAIDVPANADAKVNVTIENLTVDCTASYCQRGINYNDDGVLKLNNVTVKGTNVTYALNLPGSSDNCEVAINNSSLTGNIALNVWGENSTINAENTTFTAVDNNTAEGYAAVKLNNDGTTSAEGSVITITGGKIDVTGSACTDTEATSNGTSTGKINISDSTVVNGVNAEMVAVIRYADGNSYSFMTIEDAIEFAKAGETVTLIRDITASGIITINKAITLNGNGKTLTSTATGSNARAINVSGAEANGVKIQNLTINASGERAINIIQNATNVTVDNVTATAANYTVNVAASAPNAVVAISGSNLTGLNVVNVGAPGSEITINGGTITCNDQTEAENYAALALNKDAVGAKIATTGVTFDIKGDSKKAKNGAEGGVITIDGKTDEVVVNVAYIYNGGNYYYSYPSLEAAIDKAEEGDTITLIRDVTVAEKITIAKSITLDGNGKTLTYTGYGTSARAIDVPAADGVKLEVTIKNLTVDCTSSYCQRGINYNEDGKLTLEGVTVKGVNVTYAVNLPGSADNAEITIKNSDIAGNIALNVWGENSVINAENTVFTAVDNNTVEGYAAVKLNNDGTTSAEGTVINITGGKIDVTGSAAEDTEATSNATSTGKINISDSTVVNGMNAEMVAVIRYADGNSYSFMTIEDAIAKAQAGETVTLIRDITASGIITINKAITLDLNGKKVTSTAKKAFEVYANATIKNGAIEAAQRCVDTRKAVELTLTNVTLIADEYTTYGNPQPLTIGGSDNGTEVTMENVEINAGTTGYGIITFVETKLTAKESAISGYSVLYVKPGSDNSEFNFANSDLSGTIGDNDVEGNSFSTIAVRANNVAVNVDAESTVTANGDHYYAISFIGTSENTTTGSSVTVAGTITGNILADLNGNTVKVKAEYADELAAAGYATIEAENGLVAAIKAVAKIGETYYATLAEAFAAAQDGETITVLQDIEVSETIVNTKKVTLDLNDKTVTGTPSEAKAYAVITNYGTLTISNGSVICNHTLAGSTGYAVNTITNCGTLTIEDATIENHSTAQYQIGYAIDNNSTSADAVVNIKGGKVIASGSLYYDGIRQFCNSQTKENSVVVSGGEVSTIWMQNPSDGATKNTKDVKGSIAISGGKVGVLSLEPSANFEAAVTGGHFGEISYFQTAEGRDLKGFVTGGTFDKLIDETLLAMGYQLTGDAAPYTVAYTGEVTVLVLVDGEVTEFVNEKEITVGTLTYKRSNIKNTWTPFYVPFAVPVSALADKFDVAYINDVRRTDSDNNGELDKFSMEIILIHCESKGVDGSSKTLKANYPYFIRSKSGETVTMEITLTDATLYAAKENVYDCTTMTEKFEIKGNYHQILAEELDSKNDYVVGGGEWHHLETGKDYSLNPFRFYMTRSSRDGSDPTTMAPMKSMKIVVCGEEDENGATIIYDVVEDSLNNNGNDYIYDLQGRRVSEPKKGGIYIKNGKKILF